MIHTCPNCGAPLLTKQQALVMQLVSEGKSVHQIASETRLSWDTVRWHIKRAYRLLGAHTRAEAIQRAREVGIVA